MEREVFPEFVKVMEEHFAKTCPPELFVPRRCYEFDEDFSEITMELAKQIDMHRLLSPKRRPRERVRF